jgi:hypothetical protein
VTIGNCLCDSRPVERVKCQKCGSVAFGEMRAILSCQLVDAIRGGDELDLSPIAELRV